MKSVRFSAILPLFLVAALSFSCGGNSNKPGNNPGGNAANEANANANSERTNVEELALLVNVPYEAEDVVWKEYASQKRIIAVLRFSDADSTKLVAEAEKVKPPEAASISSEPWFPAELIAQGEMSGDDSLKGKAYAANQFFQPPYSNGRIIRIDASDYFILDVTAN